LPLLHKISVLLRLRRGAIDDVPTCSICGRQYSGLGNNAAPLRIGRCCDDCYAKHVIPMRRMAWQGHDEIDQRIVSVRARVNRIAEKWPEEVEDLLDEIEKTVSQLEQKRAKKNPPNKLAWAGIRDEVRPHPGVAQTDVYLPSAEAPDLLAEPGPPRGGRRER
jgi:hypothetical protein